MITDFHIDQIGNSLRARWSTTLSDPTFYVYVNALLVATTKEREWTVPAETGEQVYFQIFDESGQTPTPVPVGRATLCWYRVDGADSYRIDRLIGSTWTEQTTILTNEFFNSWVSPYLADSQTHTFRIVPLVNDVEGEAVYAWRFIARWPDIPRVSFAYDGAEDGTVTIT